ncbi:hypothetical protein ASPSYDRAFT_61054 [Aspergillus sydowii CBS 593.65]|uniref:Dienelactone hydrolase domain-containing protein n=1 Tax=Aspergillus sydowii CBS 593.65 TaxID=1036612 RepID=A0A1L9T4S4_9EURO|nr:uncharacterized protein ASPSYDRAFT_61054 [Aspergillus sydowii CBS 593.65]OJJ54434.1 hypothetical protein ASPSYDRAFT_61054 [Aspergillus sydowii CBS 593.65]
MSTTNNACCSIQPVVAKGYKAKGEYQTINGLKTYVTGPTTATKAILMVYDIFGFVDQTIQGADILATSCHQKYRVFMPDFFEGGAADISWYSPTNEEQEQLLQQFLHTKTTPLPAISKISAMVQGGNMYAIGGRYESWSILGLCWGGKIAALCASSRDKLFKAAVQCHPAMLDVNDAERVNVPFACLASKDEPSGDIMAFKAKLCVPNHVEIFTTQVHGWMAARADLEIPEVAREYERGYRIVLEFLGRHA